MSWITQAYCKLAINPIRWPACNRPESGFNSWITLCLPALINTYRIQDDGYCSDHWLASCFLLLIFVSPQILSGFDEAEPENPPQLRAGLIDSKGFHTEEEEEEEVSSGFSLRWAVWTHVTDGIKAAASGCFHFVKLALRGAEATVLNWLLTFNDLCYRDSALPQKRSRSPQHDLITRINPGPTWSHLWQQIWAETGFPLNI